MAKWINNRGEIECFVFWQNLINIESTHTHTQSKTKRIVCFHFEIFCSDFNFDLGFLLRENCCSLACKFIMHKMPTEILIKYILKVLLFAHTHTHTHECHTRVCVCTNNVCIFIWQTFYGLLLLLQAFYGKFNFSMQFT